MSQEHLSTAVSRVPRVGIVPGPGVVVRFGPTIGVFAADTAPDEPFTRAWLDRLSRWDAGDAVAADSLAWEAAELLVAHRRSAPAWGAAIRIPGGYLMLLYRSVRAQVDGPAGRIELSGARDLTWVDRRIDDPVTRVALSLSEAGEIVADPRSDLRGGLVPSGSGLVLTAPGQPVLTAPGQSVLTAPGQPVLTAPGQSVLTAPGPVVAHPPAPAVAGTWPVRTADETQAVTLSTRMLVADDGTRTILDREYVFGRDPASDPAVRDGVATPITVDDPEHLVSRVQARVAAVSGAVTVCDAGSANGTFIAPPGARQWTAVGAVPVALPDGWSMRLGTRVYTHVAPSLPR